MLIAAASLLSCKSYRDNNLIYFKNIGDIPSGTLSSTVNDDYRLRIQPDDELVITVTSAIFEATAAYNLPMNNPATRGSLLATTQPRSQTYLVDANGDIMMPVLGRVNVGGKTTDQIAEEITRMVAKDVKDPFVRVDIVNFGVDVLGEVRSPHRVITGQQIFTILDAISACGDLSEYGRRDRIFVIRYENGQRNYHRLNLSDSEIFNSPYFYLRQNDIVYVEPNDIRIDLSKYSPNNSFKLSTVSTIVSGVSVIVSLIIALSR